MKKLLFTLLIVIFFASASLAEEIFFGIPSSIKINANNILIQNGPTPNLQGEIIEERMVPENNLMEELETELIEIHATQICA